MTSPLKLFLLTTTEKREELLDMTDAAALRDSTENAKRAMEVLSEAINGVFCNYNVEFYDFEK